MWCVCVCVCVCVCSPVFFTCTSVVIILLVCFLQRHNSNVIVYCFSLLSQMTDCEQLNVQHSDSVPYVFKTILKACTIHICIVCKVIVSNVCIVCTYVCTYVYRVPISVLLCVMCY